MSTARTIESLEKAVKWLDGVIAQHDEAKHGPMNILVAVRDQMLRTAQDLETNGHPKGMWWIYVPHIIDGKLHVNHARHTEQSTLYELAYVDGRLVSKEVSDDD